MIKIKVWKKDSYAKLPEKATPHSIGYDLFALEETVIPPKECRLIRTGLVIQAQFPYALFIFPRSSLFQKKNLIMPNSAGIIDFDYCGKEDEVKVPLLNLGKEEVVIKPHEKIAQAVFLKITFPELEEISEPPQKCSRGGFGSSGGYQR